MNEVHFSFFVSTLFLCNLCSISTLFNRAKTATILGVVLFFAGYMPYFAVGTGTATASAQLASSLLSPTAFALLVNLAGTFEQAGSGVQWSNLADDVGGYTIVTGSFQLAFRCFATRQTIC